MGVQVGDMVCMGVQVGNMVGVQVGDMACVGVQVGDMWVYRWVTHCVGV